MLKFLSGFGRNLAQFAKSKVRMGLTALTLVLIGIGAFAYGQTQAPTSAAASNGAVFNIGGAHVASTAFVPVPTDAVNLQLASENASAGWRIGSGRGNFTVDFRVTMTNVLTGTYPVFPGTGVESVAETAGVKDVRAKIVNGFLVVERDTPLGGTVTVTFKRNDRAAVSLIGAGVKAPETISEPYYVGNWYSFKATPKWNTTVEVEIGVSDLDSTGISMTPLTGTVVSGYILTSKMEKVDLVWDNSAKALKITNGLTFKDLGGGGNVVAQLTGGPGSIFGLAVPAKP